MVSAKPTVPDRLSFWRASALLNSPRAIRSLRCRDALRHPRVCRERRRAASLPRASSLNHHHQEVTGRKVEALQQIGLGVGSQNRDDRDIRATPSTALRHEALVRTLVISALPSISTVYFTPPEVMPSGFGLKPSRSLIISAAVLTARRAPTPSPTSSASSTETTAVVRASTKPLALKMVAGSVSTIPAYSNAVLKSASALTIAAAEVASAAALAAAFWPRLCLQ